MQYVALSRDSFGRWWVWSIPSRHSCSEDILVYQLFISKQTTYSQHIIKYIFYPLETKFNINYRFFINTIMNQLYNYFVGDNVANYVEVGFSEEQAKAMSWIAEQKPKGKFYGLTVGSFIAFGWGHWHDRVMSYLRFHWHKGFTQLAIVGAAVTFGDYLFSGRRHGADQYLSNALFLNNNLFKANLDSLIENFNILNRRFTPEQIKYFNERAIAVKSNIDLKDRKWIYNPVMYTEEEFARRVKLFTDGPWTDRHIANNIKFHNMDRGKLQLAPTKLHTLIDETGDKLGITKDFNFGWTPLK